MTNWFKFGFKTVIDFVVSNSNSWKFMGPVTFGLDSIEVRGLER